MLLTKEYIITNLLNKYNELNTNLFKHIEIPLLYNWCENKSEYLYAILNDLNKKPLCQNQNCQNIVKYVSKGKYKEYCSNKCANESIFVKEKRKKTKIEKYGDENYNNREKAKETCLEKYGCEYFTKTKLYKEKVIETNEKKYNKKYFFQTNIFKEKSKETCLNKYNTEFITQTQLQKQNSKQTKIEKYGDENYNNREKAKETCLEKYGYKTILEVPKIIKIIKENKKTSTYNKYNVNFYSQINIKNILDLNKIFIENNFINNKNELLLNEYCVYFNISINTAYKYLREFEVKYKRKTNIENEINKIFDNIFEINNKKLLNNLEIDLISYKMKLCIEYNGLMFHSFGKSNTRKFDNFYNEFEFFHHEYKQYQKHLIKTELCEKENFQLFHIFENEWLDKNKQEIWNSIINNKLQNSNKLYARNCYIKEIDSKVSKKFIDENHLQGNKSAKIKIGLFLKENNQLVSVMTFGNSRYNKNYEYELLRFVSKKDIIVIGAGSKLLKYFENKYNPTSIISYANRRWSNGNFYNKLGFELLQKTQPNYFYFKNKNKLYSREHFQKHKIKEYFIKKAFNILEFDENKTEYENMYNNGYRKIYDSGNLVFIKKY